MSGIAGEAGNYFQKLNPGCKVVGLTATPNRADKVALGLAFEAHVTGYGGLATSLEQANLQATKTMTESIIQWQN